MFTFKTDGKKGKCRKYSLQLQPTKEQVHALSIPCTRSACTSHLNAFHCLLSGIVLFLQPFFTRHESSGIVEITISWHEEAIFRMMFPILICGFLVTITNAFKVNSVTFRAGSAHYKTFTTSLFSLNCIKFFLFFAYLYSQSYLSSLFTRMSIFEVFQYCHF